MASKWVIAAVTLSGLGVAACLYLSFGAGLVACPLCIYQRAFLMAAFGISLVGAVAGRGHTALVCSLLLPVAVMGIGIAAYHEYLIRSETIECPPGLLAMGSLPTQSLVLFSLLSLAALMGVVRHGADAGLKRGAMIATGVIIGALVAWASVASAPPIPVRKTPYDAVKDVFNNCRPVYKAPQE